MQDARGRSTPLPALSLRELRLLASRLGLGRYAALSRSALVEAIRGRIERLEASQESPQLSDVAPAPPTPAVAAAAPAGTAVTTTFTTETAAAATAARQPPAPATSRPGESSPEAGDGTANRDDAASWITFSPQDDRWAEVRWRISARDRSAAMAAGGTDLCLRLADVTGLSEGETLPHALQEVVVGSAVSQWYLPIPVAGRSYRVELGFRTGSAGGWIAVAVSAGAAVPLPEEEAIATVTPLPFVLPVASAEAASTGPAPADGPHERLYQVAASGWRQSRQGSEAFQAGAAGSGAEAETGAGQQDSGAGLWASGLWASGRQQSGAGAALARQRRFWLVADAELIVHAATEPSALLTIGDAPQPLSAEGTLRLHVPFPDGEQHYPIAAVAADGQQRRQITLSFRRGTPTAQVNRPEEAVDTWF